ncbi:MAG: DUF6807 family protein, partial [Cyclobacteriaceae bacterium]
MNLQRISLFGLLIAIGLHGNAQSATLAKITVNSGPYDRENSIVSIHLENYHLKLEDGEFALFEVSGKQTKPVAAQLDLSKGVLLWWVMDGKTKAKTKRTYELRQQKKPELTEPKVKIVKDDKVLKVQVNGKNAIQYNFATVMPPEGVAPIYQRSGFIHPLWSPKGEVLTRIQPPDHYHHVGLWNPWTHTEYAGREIDFWNLVKAQGTVKFNTFLSTTNNDLFGGFRAIHDHIDLNAQTPDGSKVVLNEEWDVRVWNISHAADPAWVIDFTSTFNCATDSA